MLLGLVSKVPPANHSLLFSIMYLPVSIMKISIILSLYHSNSEPVEVVWSLTSKCSMFSSTVWDWGGDLWDLLTFSSHKSMQQDVYRSGAWWGLSCCRPLALKSIKLWLGSWSFTWYWPPLLLFLPLLPSEKEVCQGRGSDLPCRSRAWTWNAFGISISICLGQTNSCCCCSSPPTSLVVQLLHLRP